MTPTPSLRERVAEAIRAKAQEAIAIRHAHNRIGYELKEEVLADAALAVFLEELVSEDVAYVVGVEICKAVARAAKGDGILLCLHGDDIAAALQAAAKKMGGKDEI